MGLSSIWHWLIVLVIVMLIFGTKKLRNIGQDLGGAVKGFKDGMRDANAPADQAEQQKISDSDKQVIEGEAREKTDKLHS